jgi:para-nitrobenzyl esterase
LDYQTKQQEVDMSGRAEKLNRFMLLVAVAFIAVGLAFPSDAAYASNDKGRLGPLVTIQQGMIEGFNDASNTWSWQGIPYARPPVGKLRWKAPITPKAWKGIRETKSFSEKCSQFELDGSFNGSEDCLYLNVWRPATQEKDLPVYFWIHGGGNSVGSASDANIYGNRLAANANMVVVTINYRLGPMGWFIHECLEDDDPVNSSGNYGTLDIIEALKWVKKNIKEFGGNPGNVTIAGESAGGTNVLSLLISPIAKGLFHKAISQSGSLNPYSKADGYASADSVIASIIDADPDAVPEDYDEPSELSELAKYLRSRTAEEIFSAYPSSGLGGMLSDFPNVFADGVVIHSDGAAALNNPDTYNQVPTILGSTKEEIKAFIFSYYGSLPDDLYQYIALMLSMEQRRYLVDDVATALSAHESQPKVFAFQLDYGAYNANGFNAWPTSVESPAGSGNFINLAIMLGAGHALDIPFFFNYWSYFGSPGPFTEANRPGFEALSEDIISYLVSFTRTGIPSNPDNIIWEPWSNEAGGSKRILFDADDVEPIISMSNE